MKLVNAVRTAFDGARAKTPVTRELLSRCSPMFGIENVAAVMAAIDKENRREDQEGARERQA